MSKRIWELDAFRGLCILGMVAVHLVFDLVELYGFVQWEYPPIFTAVSSCGGVLFLVLSGICVTLGSHNLRRGAVVFGCGMLCTAVTAAMYHLGMAGSGIIIRFGVLHCLGICMMAWSVCRHQPIWAAAVFGTVIAVSGVLLFGRLQADIPWLVPLGILYPGFTSADFFPLFPHFGFFLLGSALGKKLYGEKTTLFPSISPGILPIRFLCWCGRQSLLIYLLHQPVLSVFLYIAAGII